MSRSLQIDHAIWKVSFLGEQALSLTPDKEDTPLSTIHEVTRKLEASELPGIIDVVSAYKEIALLYNRIPEDLESEVVVIQHALQNAEREPFQPKQFEVPVCYEMGLDWKAIEVQLSLPRQRIIELHCNGEYNVAMMGFLPGFLYLNGLKKELECPRRAEPRTKIPTGAVGIGGAQTGIYSLESPGGWQIIGRTPIQLFDIEEDPPIQIRLGDRVRFTPISELEFSKWSQ